MRPRWYRPARHPDLEEDPALTGRPAEEEPDFDDEQDRALDRAEGEEAREERERRGFVLAEAVGALAFATLFMCGVVGLITQ